MRRCRSAESVPLRRSRAGLRQSPGSTLPPYREAGRAARWFLQNFPGDVAYAYKANSSVFLLGALYGAGIRNFDVASLPEIEDAATIPGAELHYMHPVKSRTAIRRAFSEFGVRSFALDSEEELKKIAEETGGCRDLTLWVRVAVSSRNSKIPLERKFGATGAKAARLLVKARQAARELGITFHVGSQTVTPDAYVAALAEVGKLIVKAGVMLDHLDVGGGFPSIYDENAAPAPLSSFMSAICDGVERLPIGEHCRLMCEPGRALVAEAESLIVRVDHRRGNELFINDGSYGMLFDAAHLAFNFPVRRVGQPPPACDGEIVGPPDAEVCTGHMQPGQGSAQLGAVFGRQSPRGQPVQERDDRGRPPSQRP